jgi:GH15 family glucan-1,4-alpha-glucosidase
MTSCESSGRRLIHPARQPNYIPPLLQARESGYLPIEDYALIGNMRTAALVSKDSSIDSFCFPYFDSPSVFCRLLDKDIGGHFQIAPSECNANARQHYLPSTAIVITKWLSDRQLAPLYRSPLKR